MAGLPTVLGEVALVGIIVFWSAGSIALPNPDKPDLVAAFESRAHPYQEALDQATTTIEIGEAYADYNQFLEEEIESAREELAETLPEAQVGAFRESQRHWEAFKEAEFRFIRENWNRIQFGSSSVLSRGAYRSLVLEDRVITLLRYLQNY